MAKLELYYPVKPFHLNQGFGENPEYYAKFKDQFGNPYKGHNGWDFMAVHGEPVYATIDGNAVYLTDPHGGVGVIITSNEPLQHASGTSWIKTKHWHLIGDTDPKFPKPFEEKDVKVGDLIGYADNTGAPWESNGDHLHFGLEPVDKNGNLVNPGNGFNGEIDPTPYWTKFYAVDKTKVQSLYAQLIALLQKIVGGKI